MNAFMMGLGFGIGLIIYTAVMVIFGWLMLRSNRAINWLIDRMAFFGFAAEKRFSKEESDDFYTGDEDL